jgi:hypothetical protein
LKRATEFWECDPEFDVYDAPGQGSFTARGARQKAFLYRYSSSGHNFANDGIAIVQNGKLVAHYGYQGGWESGITCLPDLDNDGLNEIALEGGFTNMGESTSSIYIFSLNPRRPRSFGSFTTADSWDSDPSPQHEETAYQIFAYPGKNPKIESQKYVKRKKQWVKVGKLQKQEQYKSSQPYTLLDLKRLSTIEDAP